MSHALPAAMLAALAATLLLGLPVAVALVAVAFLFAALGMAAGLVRLEEAGAIFHRLYGTLADRDEILFAAVPMLLFIGALLHESRLAEDLLAGVARLLGRMRGAHAAATLAVAAIQAPAAGMVGAATGALALYALPSLEKHGYPAPQAAGLVAAAGTLGVVAPPGIMLFFVADSLGVQVPALFLAMLLPLGLLLLLYLAYVIATAPAGARVMPGAVSLLDAALPALLMTALVLVVALGLATLSEAAALGASGAALAAALRGRLSWRGLDAAIRRTALVSAMIFFVYIGASVFALVFRLVGGQQAIVAAIGLFGTQGRAALLAALALVFLLGFFLDWLEILVIALPALTAALLAGGAGAGLGNAQLAACWLAALFALDLQTSFLTPPFGYALFLVHGATSGAVSIAQVWRGSLPFLALQLLAMLALLLVPELATWLPAALLDLSVPRGPKFSD